MLRRPIFSKYYDQRILKFSCIAAVLILVLTIAEKLYTMNDYAVRSHMFCFNSEEESLRDLLTDTPQIDKSIFFIDTSCISHLKKKIFLVTRQVCAVEAAARLHPNLNVHVLFASPGVLKFDGRSKHDRALLVLLQYDNIKLNRVYYDQFLLNTPLESFAKDGIPYHSPNSQIQANHILRVTTLWRYGGIFLDFNVLALRNLESLGENSIGMDHESFGNDLLKMSANIKGRKILGKIMKSMRMNYIPDIFDSLGSKAINRALPSSCRARGNTVKRCENLMVYPTSKFYPNDMTDWADFFKNGNDGILTILNYSYAMKSWNIHVPGNISESMAYGKLARKLCPKVFEISEGFIPLYQDGYNKDYSRTAEFLRLIKATIAISVIHTIIRSQPTRSALKFNSGSSSKSPTLQSGRSLSHKQFVLIDLIAELKTIIAEQSQNLN